MRENGSELVIHDEEGVPLYVIQRDRSKEGEDDPDAEPAGQNKPELEPKEREKVVMRLFSRVNRLNPNNLDFEGLSREIEDLEDTSDTLSQEDFDDTVAEIEKLFDAIPSDLGSDNYVEDENSED